MPHPEEVSLGPLTLTVSNVAGWQMKFGYQLSQPYADEFELLFSFLKEQGQFDIPMARISGDLGRLAELNLSGVLILEPEIHAQCVQYRSFFVPNPEAEFLLPPHVHAVFPAGDFDSQESQRRPN